MNIGVIGYGIVGKSVDVGFKDKCNIYINDPNEKEIFTVSKVDVVENCDYIFVGVPTPYDPEKKKFNNTIIKEVITEINTIASELKYFPIVVIKSAVLPSVIDWFANNCRSIRIVISPEYLTEKTAIHDFVNQKVMILGGEQSDCEEIQTLFKDYSICNRDCKVGICTNKEAALIKYMENSFLAVNNIFLNQFKIMYDAMFGSKNVPDDFNRLLKCFHLDERMGQFRYPYTIPGPDGDIGFGGKCLPKDVQSIISESKEYGVPLTLLEEVIKINNKIRTDRDWEWINGSMGYEGVQK